MGDIRISDVAELTGLSVRYWQRRAGSGEMPGVKEDIHGSRRIFRFDRDTFEKWWAAQKQPVTYLPPGSLALDRLAPKSLQARLLNATKSEEGWVYFMACVGLIKIGYATSVKHRLQNIQTSSPGRVTLVGVMAGDIEHEAELHERFSWSRSHGEWFRPTPDLLVFIQENAQL